jgi:hypothetical protein
LNDKGISLSNGRSVARAIARSRAVRSSLKRRRRRIAAFGACLAATVGLPIAWMLAEPARVVAASAIEEARDLADMLNQRSPGSRTQAELTKHARVSAKVRPRPKVAPPAVGSTPPTAAALVDLLLPPVEPVVVALQDTPPLAPPPTLGAIFASTPPVIAPPSGGGIGQVIAPPGDGGIAHLPTSEPREVPPTSAVPEPGTWAMMLTGFGLITWQLRRRRRSERVKVATPFAS